MGSIFTNLAHLPLDLSVNFCASEISVLFTIYPDLAQHIGVNQTLLTLKRKLETSCAVCVCVCVCVLLSCVQLFATPWTVAHQIPLSMGFSRQEQWSGLPFPSPTVPYISYLKVGVVLHLLFSRSVVSDCNPMDGSTPGFSVLQYLPIFAKPMFIESVMPSNHLILCHPLLFLPSIFLSSGFFQ